MTDLSALADAIDPRRYGHGDKERMTVPCDELIAASDALRSASLTHAAGFAAGVEAAAISCHNRAIAFDLVAKGHRLADNQPDEIRAEEHAALMRHHAAAIRALTPPQSPDAGMVETARKALEDYCRAPTMLKCERCNGTGYHHGFGERGHDPDWCEVCGGNQYIEDENGPARAVVAALAALSAISTTPSPDLESAATAHAEAQSNSEFQQWLIRNAFIAGAGWKRGQREDGK